MYKKHCLWKWTFKNNKANPRNHRKSIGLHPPIKAESIYLIEDEGRICVGNITITGLDNYLSLRRHKNITWTSAGILLIWPLGTNLIEILFNVHTFPFKKMYLKIPSTKWRPLLSRLQCINCGLPDNFRDPEYKHKMQTVRGYHSCTLANAST